DGLKIKTLGAQLANLDTLTDAYSVQAQKGNVPLKDVVRLQSLSLILKNELTEAQKNIFAGQENLKILTNTAADINPLATEKELTDFYNKPINANINELQQKALATNPEYLTTQKTTASNELLLRWQQSLAVPDVTLGANYDQRGGAFNNQVNLTLSIPLPFWNRNKGNINSAEKQIAQSKTLEQQKALELSAAINTAYSSLLYQQKQYLQISNSTAQNLETVYNGVLQNFQKRNITLIEFTDFMESFNQSTLLLNEIKKQLLIAGETLNYLVNEKIF
ncbi:MAG: TolC family protein, partial [Ferruginibacter sp.]